MRELKVLKVLKVLKMLKMLKMLKTLKMLKMLKVVWSGLVWSGHVARIISLQKIYDLYGLKHHIVDMRGGVTDAGQTNEQTNEH